MQLNVESATCTVNIKVRTFICNTYKLLFKNDHCCSKHLYYFKLVL